MFFIKKYLPLIALLFSVGLLEAQSDDDAWKRDMERQMEEMQVEIERFFGEDGQFRVYTDTLLFGEDMQNLMAPFESDEFRQSFQQMFDMLEQQMQSLTEEDMQQFERFFEGFQIPEMPFPKSETEEDRPDRTPEKEKESRKKKRETYSL